jgi:hypothetical protein
VAAWLVREHEIEREQLAPGVAPALVETEIDAMAA